MGTLDRWYQLSPLRRDILSSLNQIIFRDYPAVRIIVQAALGNESIWLEQQEESYLLTSILTRLDKQCAGLIRQIEAVAENREHVQIIMETRVKENIDLFDPIIESFRSMIEREGDQFKALLIRFHEFQRRMGMEPEMVDFPPDDSETGEEKIMVKNGSGPAATEPQTDTG